MTSLRPFNFAASADGAELNIDVYGEIGSGWWGDTTDTEIRRILNANAGAKRINVRINSCGGDVFAGVAIYNMLKAHGAEIAVDVQGLAASITSVIAMAGKVRMRRGSMMMIHDPWTIAIGPADEMRRAAAMLDKTTAALLSIYVEKTGKSEPELRALLNAETWMTADEAVAAGFADEVGDGEPVTVEARGARVAFGGLAVARAGLPPRVLAKAVAPATALKGRAAQIRSAARDPAKIVAAVSEAIGTVRALAATVKAAMDPTARDACVAACEAAAGACAAAMDGCDDAMVRAVCDACEAACEACIAACSMQPDKMPPAPSEGGGMDAAARAAAVAEGVATERARLRAIDELPLAGHDALVAAAKYGDTPMDARDLAVAAWQAERGKGAALLEARARDSRVIRDIVPKTPPLDTAAAEVAAGREIARYMNAGRRSREGSQK